MLGNWEQAKDIVLSALELSGHTRDEFINDNCRENDTLFAQVKTLLRLADGTPTDSLFGTGGRAQAEQRLGEKVGPYTLVSILGQGGMGSVYLAEQKTDLFARTVALKIIPESLGLAINVEPEIHSQLEHPSIIRMYDSRRTSTGEVFIAMEWVDGLRVDEYCAHADSLAETIAVFAKVCDAVAYAHRNSIAHGDLKPENILVTADGVPHLLDFSASSTGGFKRAGPLTPAYASPEQQKTGQASTLSDVFSLGIILKNLLQQAEVLRQQRAESPSYENVRANKELRAVASQASHIDSNLRYPSVNQLRKDLDRWAHGLPVQSIASSTTRTIGMFLARNRNRIVATVVILVAVVLVVAIVDRSGRTQREESDVRAEKLASFMANAVRVDGAMDGGERIKELLTEGQSQILDLFESDPLRQGELLTALGEGYLNLGLHDQGLSVLKQATRALAAGNAKPGVQAGAQALVARAQSRLGQYEEAKETISQTLALAENLSNPIGQELQLALRIEDASFDWLTTSPENSTAKLNELDRWANQIWGPNSLASARVAVIRGYALAQLGQNEAKYILERPVTDFESELITTLWGRRGVSTYAAFLRRQGDFEEADRIIQNLLSTVLTAYGPNHEELVEYYRDLARSAINRGFVEEADALLRKALSVAAKIEPFTLVTTKQDYALVLATLGKSEPATTIVMETLHESEQLLGKNQFGWSFALRYVGLVELTLQRPEHAAPYLEQAIAIQAAVFPPVNKNLILERLALGRAYIMMGRVEDAQKQIDSACGVPEEALAVYGLWDQTLKQECVDAASMLQGSAS